MSTLAAEAGRRSGEAFRLALADELTRLASLFGVDAVSPSLADGTRASAAAPWSPGAPVRDDDPTNDPAAPRGREHRPPRPPPATEHAALPPSGAPGDAIGEAETPPFGTERWSYGEHFRQHGVEPWLLDTVKQATRALPEGYRAELVSGVAPRATGTRWHPTGRAVDVQIYDDKGRKVPWLGHGPQYAAYERMALAARKYAEEKYPREKFTWGGHFRGGVQPYDLMHFQSGGVSAADFSREQLGRAPRVTPSASTPDPGAPPPPRAATPAPAGTPIVGAASTYNPYKPGWRSGGRRTASGEPYDPDAWTAAVRESLRGKFGGVGHGRNYQPAYALIEHDGKKAIVKINDVGPLTPGRVIDLNERTMRYFDPSMKRGVLSGMKVTPLEGAHTPGPVEETPAVAAERKDEPHE